MGGKKAKAANQGGTPENSRRRRPPKAAGTGSVELDRERDRVTATPQKNPAPRVPPSGAKPSGGKTTTTPAKTTPAKADTGYAGASFHNSPAASALPVPVFQRRNPPASGASSLSSAASSSSPPHSFSGSGPPHPALFSTAAAPGWQAPPFPPPAYPFAPPPPHLVGHPHVSQLSALVYQQQQAHQAPALAGPGADELSRRQAEHSLRSILGLGTLERADK